MIQRPRKPRGWLGVHSWGSRQIFEWVRRLSPWKFKSAQITAIRVEDALELRPLLMNMVHTLLFPFLSLA